jgi:hypothetical protein
MHTKPFRDRGTILAGVNRLFNFGAFVITKPTLATFVSHPSTNGPIGHPPSLIRGSRNLLDGLTLPNHFFGQILLVFHYARFQVATIGHGFTKLQQAYCNRFYRPLY